MMALRWRLETIASLPDHQHRTIMGFPDFTLGINHRLHPSVTEIESAIWDWPSTVVAYTPPWRAPQRWSEAAYAETAIFLGFDTFAALSHIDNVFEERGQIIVGGRWPSRNIKDETAQASHPLFRTGLRLRANPLNRSSSRASEFLVDRRVEGHLGTPNPCQCLIPFFGFEERRPVRASRHNGQ